MEIARVLNAMTIEQLASLGVTEWDQDEAYDRVERMFVALCRVLDEAPLVDGARVDASWFANRIAAASVPARFRTSSSVAVDGADLETWGALHGDCSTVEFDGEAAATQLMEETPTKRTAPCTLPPTSRPSFRSASARPGPVEDRIARNLGPRSRG